MKTEKLMARVKPWTSRYKGIGAYHWTTSMVSRTKVETRHLGSGWHLAACEVRCVKKVSIMQ